MKFAARDGSAGRTLAHTSPPARRTNVHAAPGWLSASPATATATTPSTVRRPAGEKSDGSGNSQASRPTTVAFLRGQEVFTPSQGNGLVYIVRSGCIRLYKVLPDGRSINIGLLGPNTIFCQEEISDGIASGATAEALIDSTLSIVDTDSLTELIAESPELASAVVTGMTRRLTELQTLIEHLLVRDTGVRLAVTLMSLSLRFGRPTADGMIAIALPLTHQGLANMIGSNRVTVTRKLLELQENGCVRSLGRNALSVDPEKLRDYARSGSDAVREETV